MYCAFQWKRLLINCKTLQVTYMMLICSWWVAADVQWSYYDPLNEPRCNWSLQKSKIRCAWLQKGHDRPFIYIIVIITNPDIIDRVVDHPEKWVRLSQASTSKVGCGSVGIRGSHVQNSKVQVPNCESMFTAAKSNLTAYATKLVDAL